ncbi:MAG: cupredoxin domain-containing protein, partial [Oligoflexia bacterium]|nr:cupredoxin domain-containing protein [Oligoflexia bacterium]
PHSSGYSDIPQKKEVYGSGSGKKEIRDEAVKPEEVYKHGVQELSIILTETGFLPNKIYVRKNIPVRLFLTSGSPESLCFIMDDFSIREGVGNQLIKDIRLLPNKAGTYRFYCPVREIEGSMIVRD